MSGVEAISRVRMADARGRKPVSEQGNRNDPNWFRPLTAMTQGIAPQPTEADDEKCSWPGDFQARHGLD